MKHSGFKRKATKPLKRTPLRRVSPNKVKRVKVAGHESVEDIKKDIQKLLRDIVIIRDKKCILYGLRCHHEYGIDDVVWQAEHLVERSNSATYGDTRLVVLVCRNCHGWKHFKKSNHDQYDKWVKTKLSKERVALWERCTDNRFTPHRTGSMDWKLVRIDLHNQLKALVDKSSIQQNN